MKILIVDDEPISLNALERVILRSPAADFEILKADNYTSAQSLLRDQKPDIMLSDIQMPRKTGIDLLSMIREEGLGTLVIFITGYPEFEYARSALQKNAFDYLLKPVDDKTLYACLKRAVEHLKSVERENALKQSLSHYFRENQRQLKKQLLEGLLINPDMEVSDEQLLQFSAEGAMPDRFCLLAVLCNIQINHILSNQEYFVAFSLSEWINRAYPNLLSCCIGNLVYILYPVMFDPSDRKPLLAFTDELIAFAGQKLFSRIQICISSISEQLADLPHLNKQVICSIHQVSCISVSMTSESNVAFFEDLEENNTPLLELNELISGLIGTILAKDTEKTRALTSRFFERLEKESVPVQRDILRIAELNLHCQLYSILDNAADISYLTHPISRYCIDYPCSEHSREIFQNCVRNIIQELSRKSRRQKNQLVNDVIRFISMNYQKQISLTDLSDYLGRNPSYISRILNRELQKGFSQLLTERRMNAAKELLLHTSYKITDIAEMSGYTSPKYFHQVFYSHFHMTPSDYRTIMRQF